jgi:hypothetical protein
MKIGADELGELLMGTEPKSTVDGDAKAVPMFGDIFATKPKLLQPNPTTQFEGLSNGRNRPLFAFNRGNPAGGGLKACPPPADPPK